MSNFAVNLSIMLSKLKTWGKVVLRDVAALYIAGRDERTPWLPKAIAIVVVAYALSPIDLIPDFIPVVGYLDDLLIVPLGIFLAARLIPPLLMAEFRQTASLREILPANRVAAAVILAIWLAVLAMIGLWLASLIGMN